MDAFYVAHEQRIFDGIRNGLLTRSVYGDRLDLRRSILAFQQANGFFGNLKVVFEIGVVCEGKTAFFIEGRT